MERPGMKTAQTPGSLAALSRLLPSAIASHSQMDPLGQGQALELCSSGTRTLLSLSSGPGRVGMLGMSLQCLSE